MKKAAESRVSEAIVRREPEPKFTDSWHPFSHARILDAMTEATKELKLEVVAKEYSIRPESKMLAMWELGIDHSKDARAGIAILNSIDRTHAVTLSAFERVLVCSNLMFRFEQERVLFRKHTGNLEIEEIVFLAKEAISRLLPSFKRIKEWHDAMKTLKLSESQFALLLVSGVKRGVIPTQMIPEFHDLYHSEKYKDYRSSLWNFHASATEIMNQNNALVIAWKQDKLNYWLDNEVPLILKESEKPFIDLKRIEANAFGLYKDQRAERKAERIKIGAEIKEAYKEKVAQEKNGKKEKKEKKSAPKKASQVKRGSKIAKKSDQGVADEKATKPKRIPTRLKRKGAEKEIKEERKALLSPALDQKSFRKMNKEISKRVAKKMKNGKLPDSLIVKRPKSVIDEMLEEIEEKETSSQKS